MTIDDQPWQPEPILADEFHDDSGWANINRAPYDRVSAVVYKRAMNIKAVAYEPLDPAPEMPEDWQGHGRAIVRWLFSEEPGTQEGLLSGRRFASLRDVVLDPGAATGQTARANHDVLLYVIKGEGRLTHRPSAGSPVVARPLREGDAVLIGAGELHAVENLTTGLLRLIMLSLEIES